LKRLIAILAFALAACGQGGAKLSVENAEYRAPLGASGIGVGYFSITSDVDDRIVGVASPQAGRVEMHASVSDGGVTSMKRQQSVALPAGKTVVFGPNGLHLMVFTPKPLDAGATFPIQIDLESGGSKTISFQPALIGSAGRK
jgi:copper(I)-binding protein